MKVQFFEEFRCRCDTWKHNCLFLELSWGQYKYFRFTYCPYCGKKMKRTAQEKKAAKIFGVKP